VRTTSLGDCSGNAEDATKHVMAFALHVLMVDQITKSIEVRGEKAPDQDRVNAADLLSVLPEELSKIRGIAERFASDLLDRLTVDLGYEPLISSCLELATLLDTIGDSS